MVHPCPAVVPAEDLGLHRGLPHGVFLVVISPARGISGDCVVSQRLPAQPPALGSLRFCKCFQEETDSGLSPESWPFASSFVSADLSYCTSSAEFPACLE